MGNLQPLQIGNRAGPLKLPMDINEEEVVFVLRVKRNVTLKERHPITNEVMCTYTYYASCFVNLA